MLPVLVAPAEATTAKGFLRAARSWLMAACRAAMSMRNRASVATMRI